MSSLRSINVDENNQNYSSDNGNLYDKNKTQLIRYCSNETKVVLPSTVTAIHGYAFYGQSAIRELILPDSLISLNSFAFYGLSSSISTITIPKNVETLSTAALSGTRIQVVEENPNFKSVDDVMGLTKEGKKLVALVSSDFTIPDTVEAIGSQVFYDINIKQITLPNHIKIIENLAFDNCYNLEKIEIPSTIESIGETAFSRCTSISQIIIHKQEGTIAGAPWGVPLGDRAVIWDE